MPKLKVSVVFEREMDLRDDFHDLANAEETIKFFTEAHKLEPGLIFDDCHKG